MKAGDKVVVNYNHIRPFDDETPKEFGRLKDWVEYDTIPQGKPIGIYIGTGKKNSGDLVEIPQKDNPHRVYSVGGYLRKFDKKIDTKNHDYWKEAKNGLCKECGVIMENCGYVGRENSGGIFGFGTVHAGTYLYQCPKCKMVRTER